MTRPIIIGSKQLLLMRNEVDYSCLPVAYIDRQWMTGTGKALESSAAAALLVVVWCDRPMLDGCHVLILLHKKATSGILRMRERTNANR